MGKNKTTKTEASVDSFIASIENQERKEDAIASLKFYEDITGLTPQLWGPSMIGYGTYHYKYDSGREGDYFRAGFSPRKVSMTYYLMSKFEGLDELLGQLGKHKMTKSCLYIKRLSDIKLEILLQIIALSFKRMNKKYPLNE